MNDIALTWEITGQENACGGTGLIRYVNTFLGMHALVCQTNNSIAFNAMMKVSSRSARPAKMMNGGFTGETLRIVGLVSAASSHPLGILTNVLTTASLL
jgi:hypothetical protein